MEEREPLWTVGRAIKVVQLLWKTVRKFLKKLKTELLYDIAMPLLGIYLKDIKTLT